MPLRRGEARLADELRAGVLATLGGLLIACALVYLGAHGLVPAPPAELLRSPPGAATDPPLTVAPPEGLAPSPLAAVPASTPTVATRTSTQSETRVGASGPARVAAAPGGAVVALPTQPQATRPAGEPTARPGPTLTPGAALPGGSRLVVAEPGGVNLRSAPAPDSPVIAILPIGTPVEPAPSGAADVAGGPGWRRVVWNGHAGWVAESLMRPATAGR
jgi:hypothetical protein